MVKPALQAAVFVDRIPRRPYCSDDPAQGLLIRPQATALAYRHIQHNPPPHVSCLVFDVDRKPHEQHWREGYHEWRERGLPAPHWISINPENGNYHLGYLLASPVARTSAAKLKPLRYLAAIEHVLARRLGADMGYVGLITKNPVHSDWWTIWHNHVPYSHDGYLAQRQPHPAALSTPLMPGLIGMNVGGRLHLLLDGLVGRGEHGTHPPLRLTDGAPAKTQAEMLFELLLYLADALVKLAALQRDVAEQIGPHLAAADVVWQCGLGRADTP